MQRAPKRRAKRAGAAPPVLPPRTRARGLGRLAVGLLAALVVCSLIGGGLGLLLVERGVEGGEQAAEFGGGDGGGDGEGDGEGEGEGEFERSLLSTIEADPGDAAAMASLANLLATVGETGEAIDWYDRALAVDPDDRQTRLNFATTLADAGKGADAELQFRRLIELDAADPDPVFYLAELYRTWEPPRTAEAVALYRRVTVLAPDAYLAERAREELGRLEGAGGTPGVDKVGRVM